LNASEFIRKWKDVQLSEKSACHEHFLDLCNLFDHPTPAEVDKTGDSFTFEKGTEKHGGGKGWADVWKKGFFGWEYKRKHADLGKAYDQLLKYHKEALENPPLLVVCDMNTIEIHTNFTDTPSEVHRIALEELADPDNFDVVRSVFHEPEKLKPGVTRDIVTKEAARRIGEIAQRLRDRGEDPHQVALFLDRIVFCMFAEDISLLKSGLFTELLGKAKDAPDRFRKMAEQLFGAMATGGDFGMDEIRHFNGYLFVDTTVLDLDNDDIRLLSDAAKLDWSAVDPSIFGTLFERGLDPSKRSQLGAHYTSREDIETLVEPVVMDHLRRKWGEHREKIEAILEKINAKKKDGSPNLTAPTIKKHRTKAAGLVHDFLTHLSNVKVLDPACGSGNFLYVTLQKMKDLEKQVCVWAEDNGLGSLIPLVHPRQLHGIEINPYAHDLAQMTVWIGYIQWMRANGYGLSNDPILEPLHGNFQNRDAILDLTDPENPCEPAWPEVDYIIGNPPFLGGNRMRQEMGDAYVDPLFEVYSDRVSPTCDLCCYWFENARSVLSTNRHLRSGLLATQGIRGGTNRDVVKRIKETGEIFFAESDRAWILDGANVHVSMVGFDDGSEPTRILDRHEVGRINSNLTSEVDITTARVLPSNASTCFRPSEKGGSFDVALREAIPMLSAPNPSGFPNSDVLRPWVNGTNLIKVRDETWVIDFVDESDEAIAARYEAPYEYLRQNVKPERQNNRDERLRKFWWLHRRNGMDMRRAVRNLRRMVCTPRVSKHRLYAWIPTVILPDTATYAFACADDHFFGLVHSRLHEMWALRLGTRLETRPRYTPTTCFETFPFPHPADEQREAIAAAAKELDDLRKNWLNPPEWTKEEILEFPGSADGPWARYVHDPNDKGIGTVRYPRIVPKDEDCAKKLKKRTLTNLYNERPTWLDLAHKKLDQAVFAAYGWSPDMTDEEILEKLLELNLKRAAEG